ncbi:hypothetical protein G6F31_020191 [Rhizopus arrhizus]|nr:hypothetical protein G6F31_020191 [Rhizopus arrhizus]
MGGYVAFPGGVIAALRGTPLVVHEQNAVAGTANKCLAKMSRRVLSGFPGVLPKGEAMSNPVRADLCDLPDPAPGRASLEHDGSAGAGALAARQPPGGHSPGRRTTFARAAAGLRPSGRAGRLPRIHR